MGLSFAAVGFGQGLFLAMETGMETLLFEESGEFAPGLLRKRHFSTLLSVVSGFIEGSIVQPAEGTDPIAIPHKDEAAVHHHGYVGATIGKGRVGLGESFGRLVQESRQLIGTPSSGKGPVRQTRKRALGSERLGVGGSRSAEGCPQGPRIGRRARRHVTMFLDTGEAGDVAETNSLCVRCGPMTARVPGCGRRISFPLPHERCLFRMGLAGADPNVLKNTATGGAGGAKGGAGMDLLGLGLGELRVP